MKRPASADATSSSMKRPAARDATRVAKRPATASERTKNDVTVSKCKVLRDALRECVMLPMGVRNVLCSQLVHTIGVPKEDRHPVQEQIAVWVREAVTGIKATLNAQIDAAEAKLADADGEKIALEAAESKAFADHAMQTGDLNAKRASVAEHTTAETNAAKGLRQAELQQLSGDTVVLKRTEQKARMEEMMVVAYAKLKAGDDKAQHKGFVKTVVEYVKQTDVSAEMFTAAVAKAPNERSTFDNIIMDVVEKDLQKRIHELSEIISADEAKSQEWARAVQEARSALIAATHAKEAAQEEWKVALDEEKAYAEVLRKIKQALKDFVPAMKAHAVELEELEARRRDFEEGPIACLTSLETASSAKKTLEMEEAEAAALAERAAAAAEPSVKRCSETPLREQKAVKEQWPAEEA